MKKILLLCVAIAIAACTEESKDYATFSGTITNPNSDSLKIYNRTYSKVLSVAEDGTFSDTLKLEPGIYTIYDGSEASSVYLKNGFDINMTLDTKEFDETISYTGSGSYNSNFLAERSLLQERLFERDFEDLDEAGLQKTFAEIKTELMSFVNSKENLDTMVVNSAAESIDATIRSYNNYFGSIAKVRAQLPKGSTSPTWEGYEDYAGGTSSLSDFKGKYVYVDVWATWCGPCIREIPALKQLEEDFHGRNIAFVSMSIDDDKRHKGSWELAKSKWKAFVKDRELGGTQIYAPNGWDSDFITDYKIKGIGIPRFILIDPDGNIVNASERRPSNPKLKEILESLI